ncbi:MAG: phosphoribosyltransferase family protein [Egicoccus sp.]
MAVDVLAVADLLAPSRCLSCRARGPMPWCARCAAAVRELAGGCERCAGPATPGHPCWPDPPPYATTTACYDYRGPVAAAVVTAKLAGAHAGWSGLAGRLARRVAQVAPDVDAVTWVTTADRRRRRRGVDHARILAAGVARGLDLPTVRGVEAADRRHRADRFSAARAFPGSNLLVVDDVLTTGATAARVARVLVDAGAGRLHLAVLARAGAHALVADPPS